MENLKEGWTTRHKEREKFYKYFTDKKAPKVLSCMSSTVRSMLGLEFPPDLYCQNANECMNSVVKRGAKNKKMDIADCVEHLQREVLHQQNTKKLAMISRGELSVAEDFISYQVNEDDFFKMTETQKNKVFQKFCTAPLTREAFPEAESHEGPDAESSPVEVMSIGPAETCITSIPQTILEEMFIEASCILKQDDSLHQFGNDDRSYYVNDGTRRGSAFYVKIRRKGEALCETVYDGHRNGCTHTRLQWPRRKECYGKLCTTMPEAKEEQT